MSHANIQITIDTYGQMIPGEGERYVDRLDEKTGPSQPATQTQTRGDPEDHDSLQAIEMIGSGGEDRTPGLGIMRPSLYH